MTIKATSSKLQKIPVSHYSGCGNDFLLLDNRQETIPELSGKMINQLCQPETGAGVDGLIIVGSSKSADVAMKYYNCDGTEAEMCGNGVRCLMQFLRQKLSYPRTRCLLQTKNRDLLVSIEASDVAVHMGDIRELGLNIQLEFQDSLYLLHYIDTGVPHVVIFVDTLNNIDVNKIGAHFRFHERFAPQGANVNFVQVGLGEPQHTAHVRTYERGVERETLACGTGVTAAAYFLHKFHNFRSPISLQVRSGEWLQVLFEEVNGKLDNVTLKGPATWIRDGHIQLDTVKSRAKVDFG